jgi:hypothetical protein
VGLYRNRRVHVDLGVGGPPPNAGYTRIGGLVFVEIWLTATPTSGKVIVYTLPFPLGATSNPSAAVLLAKMESYGRLPAGYPERSSL